MSRGPYDDWPAGTFSPLPEHRSWYGRNAGTMLTPSSITCTKFHELALMG